jgi:importin subunit beta-1
VIVKPKGIAPSKKMAMVEVTQILLSAQSADASVRQQAEESLKQFQEQNFAGLLLSLSRELSAEDKPADSRRLAGLVLKNALDAKEAARKEEYTQRWIALDVAAKKQIKAALLSTLGSMTTDARHTSAQVIAKVAAIELPRNEWPELIATLLSNMGPPGAAEQPAQLKQSTLEALGYVCEEISSDVLAQDQVNSILTAVVQGMNVTETSNEVRLAATRALYNALDFAQTNFENEMERNYIMQVVCQTTSTPDVKVRQAAFECLVAIAGSYYEKLAQYMPVSVQIF